MADGERSLDGQVALVTGGGKGVGRAVALALAARGVRVVVTGRDERALGEVVGEIANGGGKARHLRGDVRDEAHVLAAVRKAVETFGPLSIVFAGATQHDVANTRAVAAGIVDMPGVGSDDRESFGVNVQGTELTFQTAAPFMTVAGWLLARGGRTDGPSAAGEGICCASHAKVITLVRSLAVSPPSRQLRCNAICEAHGAEPEDVGELVASLCSSEGDGVTGQALLVRPKAKRVGA